MLFRSHDRDDFDMDSSDIAEVELDVYNEIIDQQDSEWYDL